MLREIRFNVGGDQRDDQPYIMPDRVVDPATNEPTNEKPEPIPVVLGREDADGFHEGATPANRGLAKVPAKNTGGSDFWYQHGQKTFRVILPPPDRQFQNEAGLPPCLPPEYNGDADRVALHYTWIMARPGITRIVGKQWVDDAGPHRPLGLSLFWALGGWMRGQQARVRDRNWAFIQKHHAVAYRGLASVKGGPWDERNASIDPSDPNWAPSFAAMIDDGYQSFGLKMAVTVIGGGCPDPIGIGHRVHDILADRREKILCVEAVNEQNCTTDEAVAIARMMLDLGVPVSVGLGNAGIDAIKEATARAGATYASFHQERSGNQNGGPMPEDDRKRNARQCWDYKDFPTASACGEPGGIKSSVAEIPDPVVMAAMRAGNVICGAGYFVVHPGAGVFGVQYPYNDGVRHANLDEVPGLAEMVDMTAGAVARVRSGAEDWPKTNGAQGPLPITIAVGDVNKLYTAVGPGKFAGIIIGTSGTVRVRAAFHQHLEASDPSTGAVLAAADLHEGEELALNGAWSYVLEGANL